MNQTGSKAKKFGLIGLLVVLLIAAFFTFRPRATPEAPGLSPAGFAGGESGQPSPNQQFLSLLTELKGIELSETIFERPDFAALKDFSQPLPTERPGRVNPFSPLGVGGAFVPSAVATSTPTTTPAF